MKFEAAKPQITVPAQIITASNPRAVGCPKAHLVAPFTQNGPNTPINFHMKNARTKPAMIIKTPMTA